MNLLKADDEPQVLTVTAQRLLAKLGFNELLLGGVIVLMMAGVAMALGLYALPQEPLQLPELQPTLRIARVADLPVGSSRIVHWGDRIIVVVRSGEQRYVALQGAAPSDGCILRWDVVSSRLVSPCSYVVYDLHGNVVVGLTRAPLRRYSVFERDGYVYVGE